VVSTPQQPELHRSGHSKVTPPPPDERVGEPTDTSGEAGPVPPANRPGRRPRKDQDKPAGPPPTPKPRIDSLHRFQFRFEPLMLPAAAAAGVTPWTAWLELDRDELRVRFGLWSVRTPRSNIEDVERTGSYRFLKVAGPPHLSWTDRGLTMATNRHEGVCIHFADPITGIEPTGRLRHPALTVTVDDPDELVRLLGGD
jgi:hypothetical protein